MICRRIRSLAKGQRIPDPSADALEGSRSLIEAAVVLTAVASAIVVLVVALVT